MAKIKDNERVLKAARAKQLVTYNGVPIRLSVGFSAELCRPEGSEWHHIFMVMEGKNLLPRIFYLAKLSFRLEAEIKSFIDKQKLKEFSTIKTALQEMLKGVFQVEKKRLKTKNIKIMKGKISLVKANIQ